MIVINMIEKTETYQEFLFALKNRVKTEERGEQQRLAIEAKISEPYISQILSGVRKASFKAQVAIAIAAGYRYENFLKLGRDLLLIERRNNPNFKNTDSTIRTIWTAAPEPPHKKKGLAVITTEPTHEEIIRRFKDKPTARLLNDMLVDIEDTNPDDYELVQGFIKTVHKRNIQKKITKNGSD